MDSRTDDGEKAAITMTVGKNETNAFDASATLRSMNSFSSMRSQTCQKIVRSAQLRAVSVVSRPRAINPLARSVLLLMRLRPPALEHLLHAASTTGPPDLRLACPWTPLGRRDPTHLCAEPKRRDEELSDPIRVTALRRIAPHRLQRSDSAAEISRGTIPWRSRG